MGNSLRAASRGLLRSRQVAHLAHCDICQVRLGGGAHSNQRLPQERLVVGEVIASQSCSGLEHDENVRALDTIEIVPPPLRQLHRLSDALAKLAPCLADPLVREGLREPYEVVSIFHVRAKRLLRRLPSLSGHF
jgi:hypothetical protein